MNDDTLKGQWKQFRGEVQKQWGKLTNDDLDEIAGEREKLTGKLQERYGRAREDVHKEVDEWFKARKARTQSHDA
jgi:uncharacterized protein YjbJ (UPF0337 family)